MPKGEKIMDNEIIERIYKLGLMDADIELLQKLGCSIEDIVEFAVKDHKPQLAQKKDFKTSSYEKLLLSSNCSTYEDDLFKPIRCADCGNIIIPFISYTSCQFFSANGCWGYLVCTDCNKKEYKQRVVHELKKD